MRLSKEIIRNAILDLLIAIVVFIIDIFDLPSRIIPENFRISCDSAYALVVDYLGNNGTHVAIIAVALLVIIVLCIILDAKRITETFVNKSFNNADKLIVNSLLICGLLFRIYEIIGCDVSIKMNLLLLFVVIAAMYLAIRFAFVCCLRLKEKPSNIISIADLYNNNLPEGSNFLFIEDTETDQDIIGQDVVVEKLYNIATSNANDKSLTVSLVGPWGSGKSSVLNLLKKKIEGNKAQSKRIVFIDSFNPWNYDNTEEMARSFAEAILRELGLSSNSQAVIELANSLMQIFPEQHVSKFFSIFKIKSRNNDPIQKINDYLSGQNKQLVIVLDNLERGEPETMIRLLKAIKNNMGLKSVIYILSYDDKIMNDILADRKLDRKYLEKFSQLQVRMPVISEERKKEITEKCIKNYLKDKKVANELIETIGKLPNRDNTLRKLLLAINSIYSSECNYLNTSDALVLDMLSQEAPELYDEILSHQSYYVYNESITYFKLYSPYEDDLIEKYCKSENGYFKALLSERKLKDEITRCWQYLTYLFPHIEQFLKGNDNKSIIQNSITSKNIKNAKKSRRIRTNEFFAPYFTWTKNKYTEAEDKVDQLIENDSETVRTNLFNYIKAGAEDVEKIVLQRVEERMDDFSRSTFDYIAKELAKNLLSFSRKDPVLGFSPRDKASNLLNGLLYRIDNGSFEEVLKSFNGDYKHLETLHDLEYWGKNMTSRPDNYNDRYNAILNKLNLLKDKIINDGINLYTKNNYQRYNSRLLGEREQVVEYTQRIKNKVSKKCAILIIADAISKSYSSDGNMHYEVDRDFLQKIFTEEEIEAAIKNAKESELKTVIKEIVEGAKEDKHGFTPGSKTYTSKKDFDLTLLTEEYIEKL